MEHEVPLMQNTPTETGTVLESVICQIDYLFNIFNTASGNVVFNSCSH